MTVPTYTPPPSVFDLLYPEQHNETPVTMQSHVARSYRPAKNTTIHRFRSDAGVLNTRSEWEKARNAK